MPASFLDKLHVAATSPFAFVAYVLLVAGWVYYAYAVQRIKAVTQGTKELKNTEQLKAVRGILKRDLELIPVAKRYQALVNQQKVFALIVSLIAVLVLGALLVNAFTMTPAEIEKRLGKAMGGVEKGLALNNERLRRTNETIAKMDASRRQLQDQLDAKQKRNEAALAGVSQVVGMAKILGDKSPEIEKINQELQELVEKIREDYAEDLLPRDADVAIRQARAMVAISERRFSDTLQILPDDIVKAEFERAGGGAAEKEAVDRACEMAMARSSALQGLGRWEEALAMGDQAELLRPGMTKNLWVRAMCLYSLSRFDEAVSTWDRLEPLVAERMVHDPTARGEHASVSHNKGMALAAQGKNEEALKCFERALDEFDGLISTEERDDLLPNYLHSGWTACSALTSLRRYDESLRRLEPLLTRALKALETNDALAFRQQASALSMIEAHTLSQLGRFDEAIASATIAVEFMTQVVYQNAVREAAPGLAMMRAARAVMYMTVGRREEAIQDQTQAIKLFEHAVNEEKRSELTMSLAAAYDARGLSYAWMGRPDLAIQDQGNAIDLYEKGAVQNLREQNNRYLAQIYLRRSGSYHLLMKAPEAMDDLAKAIQLSDGMDSPKMDPVPRLITLSTALTARARLFSMTQRADTAGADYERSVDVLEPFLKEARGDVTRSYCEALVERASWYAGPGKKAEAARDAARTLQLLEPIAVDSKDAWTNTLVQRAKDLRQTIGNE